MAHIDADSIRWARAIARRMSSRRYLTAKDLTPRHHLEEELVSAAMESLVKAAARYDGRIPWLKFVSVEVKAGVRAELRAWDLVGWKVRAQIRDGFRADVVMGPFEIEDHDWHDDGRAEELAVSRVVVEKLLGSLPMRTRAILAAIYVSDLTHREAANAFDVSHVRIGQIERGALAMMRTSVGA